MTDKDKELEDLKAEVAALKRAINPPPREPSRGPIDYTEGMSMPRNAMEAMVDASSSLSKMGKIFERDFP